MSEDLIATLVSVPMMARGRLYLPNSFVPPKCNAAIATQSPVIASKGMDCRPIHITAE